MGRAGRGPRAPSPLLALLAGTGLGMKHSRDGVCNRIEEDRTDLGDMYNNLASCIAPDEPDRFWADSEDGRQGLWDKLFDRAAPGAGRVDGWANSAFGVSWLPKHTVVGLVSDAQRYPAPPAEPDWFAPGGRAENMDSVCFEFDYDDPVASDPFGCRMFAKSFKPLQELRSCVVAELDRDSTWTSRHEQTFTDQKLSYREWCDSSVHKHEFGVLPVQLCFPCDTKRRAQEIMKFVLFKPQRDQAASDMLVQKLRGKVLFTVTWPSDPKDAGGRQSLNSSTVDAVLERCFKVKEGESLEDFRFLQRRGVCLAPMYDKVEISGFGLTDAIPKWQDRRYYGVGGDLIPEREPMTSSVCGRLALMLVPKLQSTKYNLISKKKRTLITQQRLVEWNDCQHPSRTNCRKAYYCWESALRRMCGITPHCCPGKSKDGRAAQYESCRGSPDGFFLFGACPDALDTPF